MLMGKLPFNSKSSNRTKLYEEIVTKDIEIPRKLPILAQSLLAGLLCRNVYFY